MACQRGTSRKQVGSDGGSGAVGVVSKVRPEAGAEGEWEVEAEGEREAEAEGEAGGVLLTAITMST